MPDESELVHVENQKVARAVGGSSSKGVLYNFLNKKPDEIPLPKDQWSKQVGRDRRSQRVDIGVSDSMFASPDISKKKISP